MLIYAKIFSHSLLLSKKKLFIFETNTKTLIFIAPGSYDVDKAEKKVHQSSSAYSFGVKYKDQKADDIPGDCKLIILFQIIIIIIAEVDKFII